MKKFLPDHDERLYRKARGRLEKISLPEVQHWAETSLWAAQEGLEGRDDAGLRQARTAVVGVLAAVDTLLDRDL